MTDKELHKLGRRELLQLLLAQGREAEKAKAKLAEAQEELKELQEGYERLKNRLNDKDAQILQLRESLQAQRQGQGFLPEEDLRMDFAQVRSGSVPAAPPPRPMPAYQAPVRPAPAAGGRPRHAQSSAPSVQRTPPPQAPRVMEVVQIVQGKMQPQSRMLLRPQRVDEGT